MAKERPSLVTLKLFILVCLLVLFPYQSSQALVKSEEEFVAKTIFARAVEQGINPIPLIKIAYCESRLTVSAKNVNKNKSIDISVFQVNSLHRPTALKLGLDISNYSDNIDYALVLYKRNGTQDWLASAKCWRNLDSMKIYPLLALNSP